MIVHCTTSLYFLTTETKPFFIFQRKFLILIIEIKLKKVSTEQELEDKGKSSHHTQITEKQSKSPYTTPHIIKFTMSLLVYYLSCLVLCSLSSIIQA